MKERKTAWQHYIDQDSAWRLFSRGSHPLPGPPKMPVGAKEDHEEIMKSRAFEDGLCVCDCCGMYGVDSEDHIDSLDSHNQCKNCGSLARKDELLANNILGMSRRDAEIEKLKREIAALKEEKK